MTASSEKMQSDRVAQLGWHRVPDLLLQLSSVVSLERERVREELNSRCFVWRESSSLGWVDEAAFPHDAESGR
jgi:hypothetical protein